MEPVKNILLQILQEAEERGITLGKTQLIKFLYLTEVETYRDIGNRVTDLNWIFHLYGPYAYEIESIIEEPEFQKETTPEGMDSHRTTTEKDFIRFKVTEPKKRYGAYVDAKLSLTIKRVVGQWGKAPLSELLDFVYFETEPMQHVTQRGEQLDFQTILGIHPFGKRKTAESPAVGGIIPMKASKASNERIATMRNELRPFFEAMGRSNVKEEQINADYTDALKEWENEENYNITIPPNLTITINNQSNSTGKKRN